MESTGTTAVLCLALCAAGGLVSARAQGLSPVAVGGSSSLRPLTEQRIGLQAPDSLSERQTDWRLTGRGQVSVGGLVLSPYLGLGYHTWRDRDQRETPLGPGASQAYIPVGLTHQATVDSAGQISTRLEYKYLLGGGAEPRGPQAGGNGLRLSSVYESRDWSIGLFYQQWRLRAGDGNGLGLSSPPFGTLAPTTATGDEYGIQFRYRY